MKSPRTNGWIVFGRVVAALGVATVLGVAALPSLAGASVGDGGAGNPVLVGNQPFYLDLGGSASVGLQPTLADPKGERTAQGYGNDLVAYEASHGILVQMTQLGCPGETTKNMIDGGDQCYKLHDTQLRDAVKFLRTHADDSGIVTLDMGFNNIRSCFADDVVNNACVSAQITLMKVQLHVIVEKLKDAADPNVTIVGVGHYDPYLAYGTQVAGEVFAENSDVAIEKLNAAMLSVYTSEGVVMASVGDAFESHDVDPVNVAGFGVVPDNVAEVCALTWMCQAAPYGPNIHPDDAGYAAIASAIEATLKAPW